MLLAEIYGGKDTYRALPRNDFMVDNGAATTWHQDSLYGPVGAQFPIKKAPAFVQGGRYSGLINVGFYLQDHSANDGGLLVAPGSHQWRHKIKERSPAQNASAPTVTLHPALGEVIVWDWRTFHRGGSKPDDRVPLIDDRVPPHRTLMASSFGPNSALSEVISRGVDLQFQAYSLSSKLVAQSGCNNSLCSVGIACGSWLGCTTDFVKRALERRPLPQQESRVD